MKKMILLRTYWQAVMVLILASVIVCLGVISIHAAGRDQGESDYLCGQVAFANRQAPRGSMLGYFRPVFVVRPSGKIYLWDLPDPGFYRVWHPQLETLPTPFDSVEYGQIDQQIASWSSYERLSGPEQCIPPQVTPATPTPECGRDCIRLPQSTVNPAFIITLDPSTPTPDSISSPEPVSINFRADRNAILKGECATLRWDVENVRAVYLDGYDVVGHASKQVCPQSTMRYHLRAITSSGTEDRWVTVTVTKLPLDYFALGDSIASGHGLMDDKSDCRRSNKGYPFKLATELARNYTVNFSSDHFLACSGATALQPSAEVLARERNKWLHNQVLKILPLIKDDQPTLVSISIGANDFHWTDLPNMVWRLMQPADSYLNWVNEVTQGVTEQVQEDLRLLLAVHPNVVVIINSLYNPFNYQSVFFSGPVAGVCGNPALTSLLSMGCYDKVKYAVDGLNTALVMKVWVPLARPEQVKLAHGVSQAFVGHEAPALTCGTTLVAETWVQFPLDPNSNSFPLLPDELVALTGVRGWRGDCFHPNELGAQGIAEAVKSVVPVAFPRGGSKSDHAWVPVDGSWFVQGSVYSQQSTSTTAARSMLNLISYPWYSYQLVGRVTEGREGFLVIFNYQGKYVWWNIGGWSNTFSGLEGITKPEETYTNDTVNRAKGYRVRVEVNGSQVAGWLDDALKWKIVRTPAEVPGLPDDGYRGTGLTGLVGLGTWSTAAEFEDVSIAVTKTIFSSGPITESLIFRPMLAPRIGTTWISPVDGMVQVYVPAGEFLMGSTDGDSESYRDERPQRKIYLDSFWIDRTDVTNSMYARCAKAGACRPPTSTGSKTRDQYYGKAEYDNYPVIAVSWNDAQQYCSWAGRRLPTEAEWEKAARGTDGRKYPWGNQEITGNLANFCDHACSSNEEKKLINDGYPDTSPVDNYPLGVSVYGALDMAGNVWQWVADWYDANYYDDAPIWNPPGPTQGSTKVLRGGSWADHQSALRVAYREVDSPANRFGNVGFRCAR
jgi:formylglycine-generating enzyme required for sulfatase activity/lysophospholipase L1-like esterase